MQNSDNNLVSTWARDTSPLPKSLFNLPFLWLGSIILNYVAENPKFSWLQLDHKLHSKLGIPRPMFTFLTNHYKRTIELDELS